MSKSSIPRTAFWYVTYEFTNLERILKLFGWKKLD